MRVFLRQSQPSRNQTMKQELSRVLSVCAVALLISLAYVRPLRAAETSATISGTVKDATGAVLPQTPVVLANLSTNASRTIVTAMDGSYLFTLVPIGTYRVTVESAGFRK